MRESVVGSEKQWVTHESWEEHRSLRRHVVDDTSLRLAGGGSDRSGINGGLGQHCRHGAWGVLVLARDWLE